MRIHTYLFLSLNFVGTPLEETGIPSRSSRDPADDIQQPWDMAQNPEDCHMIVDAPDCRMFNP